MSGIETLKPCPFCGSAAELTYEDLPTVDGGADRMYMIECRCPVAPSVLGDPCEAPDRIIAEWNGRAADVDPLFDPEAEGWEHIGDEHWRSPGRRWIYSGRPGHEPIHELRTAPGTSPLSRVSYTGAHPTRSFVMAIIEQDGGEA